MLTIRLRFGGPSRGSDFDWRQPVRTIEGGNPLSRSCLWTLADALADRAADPTPAADLAAGIAAWCRTADLDRDAPVEVVELGAGDGAFTRALLSALDASDVGGVRVRVLATDPDARTAELLARDKVLRPAIRAGRVDVACYDVRRDVLIHPLTRGDNVTGPGRNPRVVVSHGLLGRLPSDLLHFDMGRLTEHLVVLTSSMGVPDPPQAQHLSRLRLTWRRRETTDTHYPDPRLVALLEELSDEVDHGAVPIPVRAIEAVDRLARLGPCVVFAAEGGPEDVAGTVTAEVPADGIALPTNLPGLAIALQRGGWPARLTAAGGRTTLVAFVDTEPVPGVVPGGGHSIRPLADRIAARPGDPSVVLDHDLVAIRRLVADPALALRLVALLRESGER